MPIRISDSVQSNSIDPPILSREFLRRAWRVPAAADPDEATAQTIEIMCGHIKRSAQDPIVQECARSAVRQFRGGPLYAIAGIDPFSDTARLPAVLAESVWWWTKHNLRFVHHHRQIEVWLGERNQLQLLIEPAVLVRMRAMEGDCAIYSMIIPAMLECLGVRWELVTLAVDPSQPEIFGHVYPRAILGYGRRLPLDASHGKYPGWSVPLSHRSRIAVWDDNGRLVDDAGEQGFSGLHGYRMRRGFGDAASDAAVADLGSSSDVLAALEGPAAGPNAIGVTGSSGISVIPSIDPTTGLSVATFVVPGATPVTGVDPNTGLTTQTFTVPGAAPVTGTVAPSQSSAQWAAFSTAALKDGLTLAEINSIQPGTVVGANGSILRQATGLPVPVGNSLSTSLTAAGISMPMLLLAGGGLLLILAMGKK